MSVLDLHIEDETKAKLDLLIVRSVEWSCYFLCRKEEGILLDIEYYACPTGK